MGSLRQPMPAISRAPGVHDVGAEFVPGRRTLLLGSAAAKAAAEERALIPPKLREQFQNAPLMKMCLLHLLYLFACGTGDNNNALLFFQLSCVSHGHNATACAEHTLGEAQRAAVHDSQFTFLSLLSFLSHFSHISLTFFSQVSSEASNVLKYWTFGQCFVAMFSVPFWSRLSDRYGVSTPPCFVPLII